jgi:catechol 2,3-dioxygenase-like lactoylglutathione lyase family enzyme
MITRIHWAMLAVADQDTMVEFFVDKLGFDKRTDAEMWPDALDRGRAEGRTDRPGTQQRRCIRP